MASNSWGPTKVLKVIKNNMELTVWAMVKELQPSKDEVLDLANQLVVAKTDLEEEKQGTLCRAKPAR